MAICSNCGTVTDGDFCPECGARVTPNFNADTPTVAMDQQPVPNAYSQPFERPEAYAQAPVYQQPAAPYQQPAAPYQQPSYAPAREMTAEELPEKYRPLSPWAYFGYSLLFALPIAGFILLIVFSFKDSNINRRNYARSFWCALLIAAAAFLVFVGIVLLVGGTLGGAFDWLKLRN